MKMLLRPLAVCLLAAVVLPAKSPKGEFVLFVGTYTRDKSKGIYAYQFDAATGKLKPLGLAAETTNPSFLFVHPSGRYLYAVNEVGEFKGEKAGSVSAFAIDSTPGKLTPLNSVSAKGTSPCALETDRKGRTLVVANYGSGSTAAYRLQPDGKLPDATAFVQHQGSSVNAQRQRGPHAHSVNVSKDGKFVIVSDLGADKVLVYKLDAAKGAIAANEPAGASVKPGSGPRHFAFHPKGKYAYGINEMGSTVNVYAWDGRKGALRELQSLSTLPADFQGNSTTAEIAVHPSGKFVYGSNRGHDSIAVFRVDAASGRLTAAGHTATQGKVPRNFVIDPTGHYLLAANQNSDSIVVFRIDQTTGALTAAGETVEVGAPVCLVFQQK